MRSAVPPSKLSKNVHTWRKKMQYALCHGSSGGGGRIACVGSKANRKQGRERERNQDAPFPHLPQEDFRRDRYQQGPRPSQSASSEGRESSSNRWEGPRRGGEPIFFSCTFKNHFLSWPAISNQPLQTSPVDHNLHKKVRCSGRTARFGFALRFSLFTVCSRQ